MAEKRFMATHVPVLVVGAGISGLVCAYALRKAGVDARIVEATERPGGLIRSERRDGYLLELGPQSFSSTAQILDLCRELGMQEQVVEAPSRAPRFLLLNGQLRAVPLSPPAFFASSLFSAGTKWRVLRDVFGSSAPPESGDESVAAFVRRKFSEELLDKLVGPFVSGIYAGDAEKLSVRAAFPQLYEAERSAGSIVRGMIRAAKSKPKPRHKPALQTFRDGNETLVKALAASLGSALRAETSITEISLENPESAASKARKIHVGLLTKNSAEQISADTLVLATPTSVSAKLLQPFARDVAAALKEIEYARVAVVSLGYPKSAIARSLEGFGFLIPRPEKIRTLGTVWNSSLFPNRAPAEHVLLTSFAGGATDPGIAELAAEEISSIVHGELATILKIQSAPAFINVTVYSSALPQYNLGHAQRVASIQKLNAVFPNIFLTGNYTGGPAIGACIEQALSVAESVLARVKATAGSGQAVMPVPTNPRTSNPRNFPYTR